MVRGIGYYVRVIRQVDNRAAAGHARLFKLRAASRRSTRGRPLPHTCSKSVRNAFCFQFGDGGGGVKHIEPQYRMTSAPETLNNVTPKPASTRGWAEHGGRTSISIDSSSSSPSVYVTLVRSSPGKPSCKPGKSTAVPLSSRTATQHVVSQ